jgi:threonine/homoserine/homoserine lactone efflux protein
MSWHAWIMFFAASAVMGLIPGPGVTSIVGYALGSGRRTALASAAGMAVGNAIAISSSLAGVGALLAASAFAFAVLKWMGALYLIGMGIFTMWQSGRRRSTGSEPTKAVSPRSAFLSNILIGAFHPKTIVFFVAFVPQFVSPHANYLFQAGLLGTTFCVAMLITDTAYAFAASSASRILQQPSVALWSKRASAAVLVAAGVATAAAKS